LPGIFYGIGVGPGDPELITLKALKVLSDVDVLCVPKSRREKESLALAVVNSVIPKDFLILELEFPMTKDRELLNKSWSVAGKLVAEKLSSDLNVAFITIGDPTLYSTYGYLLQFIRESHSDIITETIPGVTSITACSALVQEPLVEGDEKLAVIPAAYSLEDLKNVIDVFDTTVLMKVNKRVTELADFFDTKPYLDTYFVSRCGYPDQFARKGLSPEVLEKNLDYMSLLIIKKKRRVSK